MPSASLALHTIPWDDPLVYDMICEADTIGVFQIESRAQMSMLPRLKPRCFYDLVIEVAIVRPGPIQGDMVHPYLRRRNGEEAVSFPHPDVAQVLGRTLGVPLFQEQAMALAVVAAGFTPDEADQLRRAMAAWKRKGDLIVRFGQRLIAGMIARGYPQEFAERCFEQIKGFSEYGFPESHAASFAHIVYVSAWLKRHHPAAFAAALINSQPMGFYQPAQILRDAQNHGVEVRPIDVLYSDWDCTLEQTSVASPAIRLGLRLIRGLQQDEAQKLTRAIRDLAARSATMPRTIEELWRVSGVRVRTLRALARADAFGSMKLDRQGALWHVRKLRDESLPLFDQPQSEDLAEHELQEQSIVCTSHAKLPPISPMTKVHHDFQVTGLSLKAHPLSFVRPELTRMGVVPAADLRDERLMPAAKRVRVSGLVLVRQRPSTASGIVFITLEDETGIANLIVRPKIFEQYRRVARLSAALCATGRVERQGQVIHVMVSELSCLDELVGITRALSRDFH